METLLFMITISIIVSIIFGMISQDEPEVMTLRVVFGIAINTIIWYLFFR